MTACAFARRSVITDPKSSVKLFSEESILFRIRYVVPKPPFMAPQFSFFLWSFVTKPYVPNLALTENFHWNFPDCFGETFIKYQQKNLHLVFSKQA